MAYLLKSNNYDENEENQNESNGQQNPLVNVGSSGVVNGSNSQSPVSTAGIGAGGLGSWTNIQSYLNANKQDTGTSDYVNKQIGNQFDKEKNNLNNSVNENKSKADSEVSNQFNWDQANQMMKDMVPSYRWKNEDQNPGLNPDYVSPTIGGKYTPGLGYGKSGSTIKGDYSKPTTGDYQSNITKLKNAANNQFSAPNSFSYSFDNDTQKYASNLADDNSFSNYLQNTYKERSGSPMTSGQLSLQKQLDTTNDNLAQARQNLIKQYSGLDEYKNNSITDTNNYLKNKESEYRTNQNKLRDNFLNEQEKYSNENQKEIADAMAVYKRYAGEVDLNRHGLTQDGLDQAKKTLFDARKYKARDARAGWNIINEILGNSDRKKQWINSITGEDFD